MKKQVEPLTTVALYARVSSDRQTWTSPSPPSFARSGTTPRTTATPWPASTWTRPRAAASPTGPSSG